VRQRRAARWWALIAVAGVVLLGYVVPRGLPGGSVGLEKSSQPAGPATSSTSAAGSTLVDALVVVDAGTAPDSYERDQFGQRWADVDRDGCDQRNDVLARDLVDVEYRSGTHDCVVESGTLTDPYTGELVTFEKVAGGIDIDHVVPLAAAWRAGAWSWAEQHRTEFANDLANLQATSSSLNRSKGDQGIDEWLPPDPAYTCTYAARWVQIKTRWALSVTTHEKASLEQLLARC